MKDLIKYIRTSRNLSQDKFAKELGVAFATVNRWEQGVTMPNDLAIQSIYDYCKNNNIDASIYIIGTILNEVKKHNSSNDLILFHGSKSGIIGDILPNSRMQCNFGKGFYMGTEIFQPLTLICNYDSPKLYLLSVDICDLNIYEFNDDIDWALAIAVNRGKLDPNINKELYERYINVLNDKDFIIGSIADDRMFYVLDSFFNGIVTDVGLIESLKALKLGKQYVAKTTKACDKIKILKEFNLNSLELKILKDKSIEQRNTGIKKANDICKEHRRDGKFFDEII